MASAVASGACVATWSQPCQRPTHLPQGELGRGSAPDLGAPWCVVREFKLQRESRSQPEVIAGIPFSDPFTVKLISIKARQLCRRGDFSRSDYDDVSQAMRLYLLKKAHLYNPARGSMPAFLISTLKTWSAMELRYRSREKRSEFFKALSLERTPVEFEGSLTRLGAVLLEEDGQRLPRTYPPPQIDQLERRAAVEHAMKNLQPQDRAILVYVAEHNVARTARRFGISRRQILNAIARARVHFEKAGLGRN